MAERRRVQRFGDLPFWKKVVLIPVTPVAFAGAVVGLALILLPIAAWNGVVYAIYWARYKITGSPIPAKAPLPENSN